MKRDIYATAVARFEDARSFVFKDGREQLCGYDWQQRKSELWARSGGRCEKDVGTTNRCHREAEDPHHCIPRSKGRDDRLSNLVALCRYHHNLLNERKPKWTAKGIK